MSKIEANNTASSKNDYIIENGVLTAYKGKKKAVIIPDNVIRIADSAFDNCRTLESVIIGNSVKKIDNYAFCDCENLKSIAIGSGVSEIGEEAFSLTTPFTSIMVDKENKNYYCEGNCLIENSTKMLITACDTSDVKVDDSVKFIGNFAFYGCANITSLTVPNSVNCIGQYAFDCCSGLESIVIGKNAKFIDGQAFHYCENLASITVDKENKYYHCVENCLIENETEALILGCKKSIIPSDGSVTTIGYGSFWGCNNLSHITIPDSVTWIEAWAFSDCKNLSHITIPNSVTSIDACAFSGCKSLSSITIPNSVSRLGKDVFEGCSGLERKIEDEDKEIKVIIFNGSVSEWNAIVENGFCESEGEFVIKCNDGDVNRWCPF